MIERSKAGIAPSRYDSTMQLKVLVNDLKVQTMEQKKSRRELRAGNKCGGHRARGTKDGSQQETQN